MTCYRQLLFFVLVVLTFSILSDARKKKIINQQNARSRHPPCQDFERDVCSNRGGYLTYDETVKWLQTLSKDHSELMRMFQYGVSLEGRALWAIEISNQLGDQTELKPNVKFVAAMHGDETVGREVTLRMMEYLVTNYQNDTRIQDIVDNTHLFMIPMMNPDGYAKCSRGNAKGSDLNRGFPDRIVDRVNSVVGRPPEISGIMKLADVYRFTLSANFHGGEVVVNYPYDADGDDKTKRHTDDDDVFVDLSLYSKLNEPMYTHPRFKHGITNGADWYPVYKGMQDWNYEWTGCMEITLELSCHKWPPKSDLEFYWQENRASMLAFIEYAQQGVRGYVTSESGEGLSAKLVVAGRDFVVYTRDGSGIYFRVLLPGEYVMEAYAKGYLTEKKTFSVVKNHPFIVVNFILKSFRYEYLLTNILQKMDEAVNTVEVPTTPYKGETEPTSLSVVEKEKEQFINNNFNTHASKPTITTTTTYTTTTTSTRDNSNNNLSLWLFLIVVALTLIILYRRAKKSDKKAGGWVV